MPKIDNTYLAPTWANNEVPAIDETELQAMSDTLELTNLELAFSTGEVPGYLDFLTTKYNWNFAYGNGIWVGVSTSSDAAIRSVDGGQTWTETTMPESAAWSGVAYGGGLFVACNSGGEYPLAWSSDGQTWTACTGTGSTLISAAEGVCYGDGIFAVIASNGGVLYTDDPNGDWTFRGIVFADQTSRSIAYGNGVFVSTSEDPIEATYSTDNGVHWENANSEITGTGGTVDVVFGNDVFVTVARGSSQAAWSSDGATWTAVDLPATTTSQWCFVLFGFGRFIAGNDSDNVLATSKDGKTWALMNPQVSGSWICGAYGDGQFLMAQADSPTALIGASVLYQRIYQHIEPDVLALLATKGFLTKDNALFSTVGSRSGTESTNFSIACNGQAKAILYFSESPGTSYGGLFIAIRESATNFVIYPNSSSSTAIALDDTAILWSSTSITIPGTGSALSYSRFNSRGVSYSYVIFY